MVKEFLFSQKNAYDPIHGLIRFDEDEQALIDSLLFQRLHHLRQLGATYLVFPGATHTLFEHALGLMELTSIVFGMVCKNERPDLLDFLPRKGSSEYVYWLKVLRMASLCHDLGSLPFSFVAKKEILGEFGRAKMSLKLIRSKYLQEVWDRKSIFTLTGSNKSFIEDLIKIAIGPTALNAIEPNKHQFTNWQRILAQIIHGDFLGTDKIDHLLRDSKSTGVSYALFDYLQLIQSLRILPSLDKKEHVLGIDENGIASSESLLLAQRFMYKKVYQNPSVRAYNFHLRRFMKTLYSETDILNDLEFFLFQNDATVINELMISSKNNDHIGHYDAKKIIERKDRFKAIPISDNISEKDLIKFKNKCSIEDYQIGWDLQDKVNVPNLSFPVIKFNLTIVKAAECFDCISNLVHLTSNWVYIAPELEFSMVQFLEKK